MTTGIMPDLHIGPTATYAADLPDVWPGCRLRMQFSGSGLCPPFSGLRLRRGPGLGHQQHDQQHSRAGDTGHAAKRDAAAEMIEHVAGERRAERRAYAHGAADDAEREIEPPGVARDVGDNEWKHDAEDDRGDAIEHLNDDD